ncbi:haloacid dehalogenase type II [Streptomyces sp. ARC32]
MRGPEVLVFDVNETRTDLSALAPRLADIGLPGRLLPEWFAGVLRDGIALTLAGGGADFATVARDALLTHLAREGIPVADPGAAAAHVLGALPELPVHPDVPEGVRALHAAGHRLVTLTNGSADTSRAILRRAGLAECFEAPTSTSREPTGAGNRRRTPTRTPCARLESPAAAATLVAVHSWDIDGAARAGLGTAWLRRTPVPYPSARRPADRTAGSVADLARQLGAG